MASHPTAGIASVQSSGAKLGSWRTTPPERIAVIGACEVPESTAIRHQYGRRTSSKRVFRGRNCVIPAAVASARASKMAGWIWAHNGCTIISPRAPERAVGKPPNQAGEFRPRGTPGEFPTAVLRSKLPNWRFYRPTLCIPRSLVPGETFVRSQLSLPNRQGRTLTRSGRVEFHRMQCAICLVRSVTPRYLNREAGKPFN